jgi:hypothetical protein
MIGKVDIAEASKPGSSHATVIQNVLLCHVGTRFDGRANVQTRIVIKAAGVVHKCSTCRHGEGVANRQQAKSLERLASLSVFAH